MDLILDSLESSSSDDDNAEFDTILSLMLRKKKNARPWISHHIKFRGERGDFKLFEDLCDEDRFQNYYRMSRQHFYQLHSLIKNDITKQNTLLRDSITSMERLAVTLR